MRLIDADELLAHRFVDVAGEEEWSYMVGWNTAIEAVVENAPTIDAVPVVRCRKCRYSRQPNKAFRDESVACDGVLVCFAGFDHVHPTSDDGMIFVDGDGYCSNGQRREEAGHERDG